LAPGGSQRREPPDARAPDEPSPLLAALGLAAVVLTVTAAVVLLGARSDELVTKDAELAAERRAAALVAALDRVHRAVVHLPAERCAGASGTEVATQVVPDIATLPGTELVCLSANGSDRPAELVGLATALEADEAVRIALAESRDRGVGVLAAGAGPDGRVVLAAPVYRVAQRLQREPSGRALAEVRAGLAGHVVALVEVGELLDEGEASDVVVRDGEVDLARRGRVEGRSVDAQAQVLDRQWTVVTSSTGPGWWLPAHYLVIGLGAVAIGALVLADRQRQRSLARQTAGAARAEHRSELIRSMVGVVQHRSELGEILPALVVRLADELELAGASVAVDAGPDGERELFVHGDAPDRMVQPTSGRIEQVAARETLAVDLHRADRSIAVLRVLPASPLDRFDVDLVHLVAEMVTSSIVAARSLEQQREVVARLQSLDELKTTFLGVASHELRTPATAISGLATLLADRWEDLGDEERRNFASRIATNADALNGLVQDLLDFARMERGDLELALVPVDLGATVAGVLARLEGVWSSHRVEHRVQPGVVVLGDAAAVERVVTNLVSNAVKFSPAGSTVTVSVLVDGDRALLLVDDDGPGVPAEERSKVFVRFFRGAGDAVVRTRGVGIGLSVVQDFVGQMGGSVRIDDAPGGGARFAVELPVHDRSEVEVPDAAAT
jgi:signal transduction histidine kinase